MINLHKAEFKDTPKNESEKKDAAAKQLKMFLGSLHGPNVLACSETAVGVLKLILAKCKTC